MEIGLLWTRALSSAFNGVAGPGGRCVGDAAGFLTPEKPRVMTEQGCVCKLPFRFVVYGSKQETVFVAPTDLDSPNHAWCAVDAERSPPDCGTKSVDPKSGFGAGRYGWDRWDYVAERVTPHVQGVVPAGVAKVVTQHGCTCRMPYSITPPGVGEKLLFSTCNRYLPGEGVGALRVLEVADSLRLDVSGVGILSVHGVRACGSMLRPGTRVDMPWPRDEEPGCGRCTRPGAGARSGEV